MPAKLLLIWWNLIYIVPFGIALLYLLVYAATGLGGEHGDVSVDADADADLDADVDADVDVDADADLDADVDADADFHAEVDLDADADADVDADADTDADAHVEAHLPGHDLHAGHGGVGHAGGPSPLAAALGFLGLGKAPVSILILMLLIAWSIIGFVVNQLAYAVAPNEWLPPLLSLPLAFVGSLLATAGLARLLGRYMPSTETYVHRKDQLVGRHGTAIYAITDQFGLASVHDTGGDLFQVPCRTAAGAAQIPATARIVLFDYDAERSIFFAAPFDEKRPRPGVRKASQRPLAPADPLPRSRSEPPSAARAGMPEERLPRDPVTPAAAASDPPPTPPQIEQ